MADEDNHGVWFLKSSFPVSFPSHPALMLSDDNFENFLQTDIRQHQDDSEAPKAGDADNDSFTLVSGGQSTTAELRQAISAMDMNTPSEANAPENEPQAADNSHTFVEGLLSYDKEKTPEPRETENKMFTENLDLAHRSTGEPLLDLSASLEEVISGPQLLELLNAAWADNPLLTLKIIYNARSIHLGKASRTAFYRCAGWLAQNHPATLVVNLRWLSRPIIQKKVKKKNEGEDEDMVIVEKEKDEDDITRFDIKNGVSHGYWKDLLNILALSANGMLTVLDKPSDLLNTEREGKGQHKGGKDAAKAKRHEVRDHRHDEVVALFNSDPVHRALHLAIARLFAEQLKSDLALLKSDDVKAKKNISLCAKWAPSHNRFHDKHTFIVSTIAELLHSMVGEMERELYLRHARESYRKDVSALRAHLDIVERNLSAKTLEKIKYDRVPSVAMSNYTPIFAANDTERFEKYLTQVVEGKTQISGATLLPSTLIKSVRQDGWTLSSKVKGIDQCKLYDLNAKVADGQWKTLVQRIRDSGNLESSIAVCDVSGSMDSPVFPDGTCPMDSAIGLSLLLAEVTKPPFGGNFITFSAKPKVETIDTTLPLSLKYETMSQADWGQNTNFVAVFEDLILPKATRNKLKPEDMVKRVFVFSDMQFDHAQGVNERWTTSFERIKKKFADAGYDMPQMVFWNLAGGRAGYPGAAPRGGDPVVPKPVTAEEEGTAIVSGYSQGMLKVFLDNGSFEDPEEEEEANTEDDVERSTSDDQAEEDVAVDGSPKKKTKMDPLSVVRKAVGHKAYDMLKVVD